MIRPEDRILERALARVLGEGDEPVDLAPAIRDAWRRGERGPKLPRALRPGQPALRPRASRRSLWVGGGALAAAAAGVALFLVLRTPPAAAAPFAVASRPLPRVSGEPGARPSEALAAGDVVLVDGDRSVTLRLADGSRMVAGPGAVLAVPTSGGAEDAPAPTELQLLWGEVEFRPGPGAPPVSTGFARLSSDAWTSYALRVSSDEEGVDDAGPAALAALFDGAAAPRSLWLEVRAGTVEVELGERSWQVASGQDLVAAEPGETSRTALDRDRLARLVKALPKREPVFFLTSGGRDLAYEAQLEAEAELAEFLGDDGRRWALLQRRVLDALEDEYARGVDPALLDAIVRSPSRRALRTARAIWLDSPESFAVEHVLALAERGDEVFEREVREMVRLPDETAPWDPVLPAAWLAFRGESAGLAALERATAELPESEAESTRYIVAAVALATLDRPAQWIETQAWFTRRAREMLEVGELEAAARIALTVQFFHEAMATHGSVKLSFLGDRIRGYQEERLEGITSEDVERMLDRFGPR